MTHIIHWAILSRYIWLIALFHRSQHLERGPLHRVTPVGPVLQPKVLRFSGGISGGDEQYGNYSLEICSDRYMIHLPLPCRISL